MKYENNTLTITSDKEIKLKERTITDEQLIKESNQLLEDIGGNVEMMNNEVKVNGVKEMNEEMVEMNNKDMEVVVSMENANVDKKVLRNQRRNKLTVIDVICDFCSIEEDDIAITADNDIIAEGLDADMKKYLKSVLNATKLIEEDAIITALNEILKKDKLNEENIEEDEIEEINVMSKTTKEIVTEEVEKINKISTSFALYKEETDVIDQIDDLYNDMIVSKIKKKKAPKTIAQLIEVGVDSKKGKTLEEIIDSRIDALIKECRFVGKTNNDNMEVITKIAGIKNNQLKELFMNAMAQGIDRKNRGSRKNAKSIEQNSKNMPTVVMKQIYFDLIVSKGKAEFLSKVTNQSFQESILARNIDYRRQAMADDENFQYAFGTYDICSLSLSSNLTRKSSPTDVNRYPERYMRRIFELIQSGDECGLFLIVSPNGTTELKLRKSKITLYPGQFVLKYEILGVTPSGLRSRSIMLASTQRGELNLDNNEIEWKNIDKRIEILNNSSDGAFVLSFMEDGEFKKFKTFEKFFKEASRILMVSPASVNAGKVSNYLVVKNLSEKSTFKRGDEFNSHSKSEEGTENVSDVTDGTSYTSVDFMLAHYERNNIPANYSSVLGTCFQIRGGGCKASTVVVSRRYMRLVIERFLKNGTKIESVVYNGKETTVKELKENGQWEDFLEKVEHITDTNAVKLTNHEPIWEMVLLKKAHASDTCLNMVINIAMLYQDIDAAKDLLLKLGRKHIYNQFGQLGVEFDFDENGALNKASFVPENLKAINNDPQIANLLYKNNPTEVMATMPQVVMSMLNSTIISIAKTVERLRIPVAAKYMVVQSDIAVQSGVRILNDDECYSPIFEKNQKKKVSAARHPISGPYAVSTWKCLTLSEIIDRINRTNLSDNEKACMIEYYSAIKEFVIIPASHYFMEKHDGMDFDIDAMQFFMEDEVVEILSKIPDIGTLIDRKPDEAANISLEPAPFERRLSAAKQENDYTGLFNEVLGVANIDEDDEVSECPVSTKNVEVNSKMVKANPDGSYTITFDNIAAMVHDNFANPIDPVGFISTGFYNNALLYLYLTQNDPKKDPAKRFIASVVADSFACKRKGAYESPLTPVKKNGRTQYTIHKATCEEVLKAYVMSEGTVSDLIAFLFDACICNRYPGETSIDSAKKGYYVIDYFNLTRIVKALGSDKNMTTGVYGVRCTPEVRDAQIKKSNEIYLSKIRQMNSRMTEGKYSERNLLNVALIYNGTSESTFPIEKQSKAACELALTNGKIPAVRDPLAIIRDKLCNIANDIIIIVSKEMEKFLISEEARTLRNKVRQDYSGDITDEKNEFFNTLEIVSSASRMLNSIQQAVDGVTDVREKDEVMHHKEFIKTKALQGLRNFAKLSLTAATEPLSKAEIGAAVVFSCSSAFDNAVDNNTELRPLNNSILKVFEKEVFAYFNAIGLITTIGEKILYAANSDTLKHYDLSNLVGQEVSILDGEGEVDNIIINTKNRKAEIEGTIQEDSFGHFYVVAENKFLEEDATAGIFVPIQQRDGVATCNWIRESKDFSQFVRIAFAPKLEVGEEIFNNIFIGLTRDGVKVPICQIYVNSALANLIASIEITPDMLNVFKSSYGMTLHINSVESLFDYIVEDETNVGEINENEDNFEGNDFDDEFNSEEESIVQESINDDDFNTDEYEEVAIDVDTNEQIDDEAQEQIFAPDPEDDFELDSFEEI